MFYFENKIQKSCFSRALSFFPLNFLQTYFMGKHMHTLFTIHLKGCYPVTQVSVHSDGSKSLKLGDFGLATYCDEMLYTVCGTPTYVAPEIISEVG